MLTDRSRVYLAISCTVLLVSASLFVCDLVLAQKQPSTLKISYARDIAPILRENCNACHNAETKSGGLRTDSYEDLMKGGQSGPAVMRGKSGSSRLVLMLEGKIKPKMPLGGELKASEIAAIAAWIDAGAEPSEPEAPIAKPTSSNIPDIKPQVPLLPQVSSLAFRPDGSSLAVAVYKEVKLIDSERGTVKATLSGAIDVVRSVAYSPDGKYLAGAGGAPARFGEVKIWNAASGDLVRSLKGHNDFIYSIAFSPDSKLLATSSYDKLIKLWDVETGSEVKTLKDHIDAVYPIAFSPDGKWIASGAADRTVKLWDVSSGKRLFTLSDALEAVYALAFHPSGKQISAGGADKIIRTWDLGPDGATLVRSIIAHEDAIIQLAYSSDGKKLVSTSADRLVKIWDVENGQEIKVLDKQPDWPMALGLSPDGRRLCVGRYDGSVSIYELSSGRRVLDPIRIPVLQPVGKENPNRPPGGQR